MPSKLNHNYLNVISGEPQRIDIESLVKPINFCDLKQFGIQVVVDIQLIEQETNQSVNLLVLFKKEVEKAVGSKARYPTSCLAVFELTYGGERASGGVSSLKLVMTIDALSWYSRRILPAASPVDDFCYILTPFSIYLVRMEKNRVTEIQTSSVVKAIAEHFATDDNKKLTEE